MTKVAVASQQGGLEDQISPVFGRCQSFTIVTTDGEKIQDTEVIQNQYANASSGAGIQAAGVVSNKGVQAVIAGNFGPNVASVLNQSGIKMIPASGITVEKAVRKYFNNELQPVSQATSPAKAGMGAGKGRKGQSGQDSAQSPMQGSSRQTAPTGGGSSQQKSQSSDNDRIDGLEDKIQKLEELLEETRESLEELKK